MPLTPRNPREYGARVLPIEALDPRAWSLMCWRQAHLPLDRVRRRADWDSLGIVESRSARKVVSELGLGDRQGFSLSVHHRDEVDRRLTEARPDLANARTAKGFPMKQIGVWHPARRTRFLRFTVGWGTWLRNRQVGFRWRLFRVRTLSFYRGVPSAPP